MNECDNNGYLQPKNEEHAHITLMNTGNDKIPRWKLPKDFG